MKTDPAYWRARFDRGDDLTETELRFVIKNVPSLKQRAQTWLADFEPTDQDRLPLGFEGETEHSEALPTSLDLEAPTEVGAVTKKKESESTGWFSRLFES